MPLAFFVLPENVRIAEVSRGYKKRSDTLKWANYRQNKEVQFSEQKHPSKKHFNGRLIFLFRYTEQASTN